MLLASLIALKSFYVDISSPSFLRQRDSDLMYNVFVNL